MVGTLGVGGGRGTSFLAEGELGSWTSNSSQGHCPRRGSLLRFGRKCVCSVWSSQVTGEGVLGVPTKGSLKGQEGVSLIEEVLGVEWVGEGGQRKGERLFMMSEEGRGCRGGAFWELERGGGPGELGRSRVGGLSQGLPWGGGWRRWERVEGPGMECVCVCVVGGPPWTAAGVQVGAWEF